MNWLLGDASAGENHAINRFLFLFSPAALSVEQPTPAGLSWRVTFGTCAEVRLGLLESCLQWQIEAPTADEMNRHTSS
jgi:hypothetical protein